MSMQGEAQAIVLQKANKLKLQNATYHAGNPGDVLVKTIASTITPGFDRLLLTNKPVSNRVFHYPIMPGSESIGQVMATGSGVDDLVPGVLSMRSRATAGVALSPISAAMRKSSRHRAPIFSRSVASLSTVTFSPGFLPMLSVRSKRFRCTPLREFSSSASDQSGLWFRSTSTPLGLRMWMRLKPSVSEGSSPMLSILP